MIFGAKKRKKYHTRIKLRIAGISALILSLIIGTWPVKVHAVDPFPWDSYFEYELDAPGFELIGEPHTITLTRYKFPSGLTELIVPEYAEIGGIQYKTCLGNGTDTRGVFYDGNQRATELTHLDLSNVDTSKTTNMAHLFSGWSFPSVTSLNISGFDTSNVTSMKDMFNRIPLSSLDVSGFDTSNVTDMSGMFNGCINLTSLDIRHFNTSNVTDMSDMFRACYSLTTIDLTQMNTEKVTSMSGMFMDCRDLQTLDLSSFNTSNVTNMLSMFGASRDNNIGCSSLTELDLSNFDTSKVTTMGEMFRCSNLINLDLTSFDTSNVIGFHGMFERCTKLTSVDLSSFNTSKAQDIGSMFYYCTSLKNIDLSSFDLSSLDETMYVNAYAGSPFGQTSFERIETPKNLSNYFTILLFNKYWALDTGSIYENLPTGAASTQSRTLVLYEPTKVYSVRLNETDHTMTDTETFDLIATVLPSTAIDKSVTWSSSNTGIVTVDDTGLVTGIAPGEADVTVTTTDGGHTATCHFTITHAPVPVSSVSVSPTTLTLTAGDTATLTAEVLPDNADDKTVSWSSANQSIATVSDTGVVTAVAPGTTVITVTTTDGGRTADCRVTVTPSSIPVTGISLSPDTLTMTVGDTEDLTVTITPDNAGNKNVTFTSNNPSVATVDANGRVTAVSPGGAAITATTEDGGHSDTSLVIVSDRTTPVVDVTGVSLTPETLSMVVGETEPLTATVTPSNATNKNVTYTSSDPSVATVDTNGVVTAVSPGNTTVTVTTADGNKTDTCLVTVTAAPTPVSDVSLNRDTLSMTVGDTETLTATVQPTNASNKNVTYASSDPAVATVDETGVVTALSPGTTTITVTTQDGNKTDTCLVTVTPAQTGQLLTVIDRRTDAEHTDKTAAAVTSLTEPLTLTITTTDGAALRSALSAEDEIDQVSTFRLNMTDASGNPATSYGSCTVIMPLPMNFITDSGKLKLYYTNANGVLETIENVNVSTSPDGVRTISFQTPEMTEYALVHSKKETTPVTPDDGGGNNPPENSDPVQPEINVNVPTPEVNVNVPAPEVSVNVPAPQVTVNVPDATGNPSGTAVNARGTTATIPPSGTGAVTSANAGDMPRTGVHLPYRMMVVTILFIAGLILILLSLEPKKRLLPE